MLRLKPKTTAKVLAVASGGGHWVQLMRLKPLFEGMTVEYLATDAAYSVDAGKPVLAVRDANLTDKLALLVMFCQVFVRMLKVRPDVVITTGAAPGFAALFFGKLLGARTVWLDSVANSEEMSSSGKHVRRFADLWLTQWEHLAKPQGPHYLGSVI
jgi:UDP-N-acetylglucosamine:LPS N-acetylglucosamine transferase